MSTITEGQESYVAAEAAATRAVLAVHAAGHDVAEFVAHVLAIAAAELGSTGRLLANRPGSWEAAHVRSLLAGTVGPGDEHLEAHRGR